MLTPAQVLPVGGIGPGAEAFRSGWWFEPLAPTAPLAPAGQRPRRYEYTPGKNLIWTPRDGVGMSFGVLRRLSYALDVLRVVIEQVKAQIRGLDWEIRPIRQPGESRARYAARSKGDDAALALTEFFQYPDGQESFHAWLNRSLEEILVVDAWALYLERDTRGNIANVKCVDGGTIVPLVDVEGWTPTPPAPAFYQNLYGAPAFLLTTDDLVYSPFDRINRGDSDLSIYGYPPVEQVLLTINQALRNEQFALEFFTSGTLPEAIAGVPSTWSPKQIEELQQWFDAIESGNLAQRRKLRFIPTVAGGVGEKMNIIFPKVQDLSFKIEYPQLLAQIISAAFRVSAQWIQKMMNRATAEEASAQGEEVGVASWRTHIEETLNAVIQRKMGFAAYEFAFHSRQESDALKRMQVDVGYLKVGAVTVNEVREDLGRDPFDLDEASAPLVFTATGATPLETPEPEPPVAAPGPSLPPHAPAAARGAATPSRPVAAGMQKATPRRIDADYPSPLASAARQQIAQAVERAHAGLRKQLLDSPQLRALATTVRKAQAVPGADPDVSGLVLEILSDVGPIYRVYLPDLEAALKQAATAGIISGATAGGTLDRADLQALQTTFADYARTHAAALVTQISETTREDLRRTITAALDEETDADDLVSQLQSAGAFSRARAQRIARTEAGNAMIKANLATWQRSGAADYIKWEVGDDPCEVCAPNDGEVVKIGDSFPSGDTEPLAHPNCYCAVVAVDAPDLARLAKRATRTPSVYLMRHGATQLNAQRRNRGQSSVPLDADGRRSVRATAARLDGLGLRQIISSPIRRAKESAHLVGKILAVPVTYDPDLSAWDVGDLTGQPTETSGIAHYVAHPDEVPPHGESLNTFRARAVAAVDDHAADAAGDGPILIVTHNSVLMAVREDRLGQAPQPGQPDPAPPAGVVRVTGRRMVTI